VLYCFFIWYKKGKFVKYLMFVILMFALTGCFQVHNDDSVYYTVPTTNNPHIIPDHTTFIPSSN